MFTNTHYNIADTLKAADEETFNRWHKFIKAWINSGHLESKGYSIKPEPRDSLYIAALENLFKSWLEETFFQAYYELFERTSSSISYTWFDTVFFIVEKEPRWKKGETNLPACGNPECEISYGIHEGPTFGSGKLDQFGYWENPCDACAREWEKNTGEKAWPFEVRIERWNRGRLDKAKQQAIISNTKELPMPTQETISLAKKIFQNLLKESLSEDGSDLVSQVQDAVREYVADHKATQVLNSILGESDETMGIFNEGVEIALDHVLFMLKREDES